MATNTFWTVDASSPSDSALIPDGPGLWRNHVLNTKTVLDEEHDTFPNGSNTDACVHSKGSAHAYHENASGDMDTNITNRPNGSTALDSDDAGRIGIDSSTGFVAYWDGTNWQPLGVQDEALTYTFSHATANVVIFKNDEELDGAGDRDTILKFKGEQTGGEITDLCHITVSHEGTSDDQKGQLVIKMNDGDDGTTPSKTAVSLASTGIVTLNTSLAATTMSGALAMGSNKITGVATGTSSGDAMHIGQYTPVAYAGEESVTFPNGLIFKQGLDVDAATSGSITFAAAFPTAVVSGSVSATDATAAANDCTITSVTTAALAWIKSTGVDGVYWQAWGY